MLRNVTTKINGIIFWSKNSSRLLRVVRRKSTRIQKYQNPMENFIIRPGFPSTSLHFAKIPSPRRARRVISAQRQPVSFTWFLTCVSVCATLLAGIACSRWAPLPIRLASSRQSFYGNTQLRSSCLCFVVILAAIPSLDSIFRACVRAYALIVRRFGPSKRSTPLNSALSSPRREETGGDTICL